MEFNFKKSDNALIVYLKGRLDVHYSNYIEEEIGKLITMEPSCHFLFNMKDVDYISSSGLRIIVSTLKILNGRGHRLVLCNINDAMRKIFEIVQITDMFNIFNTETEAVEYLKKI